MPSFRLLCPEWRTFVRPQLPVVRSRGCWGTRHRDVPRSARLSRRCRADRRAPVGAYSFRRPSGLRAWDNDLNVVVVKDLDWVMRSTFQASNAVTVEEVEIARNTVQEMRGRYFESAGGLWVVEKCGVNRRGVRVGVVVAVVVLTPCCPVGSGERLRVCESVA